MESLYKVKVMRSQWLTQPTCSYRWRTLKCAGALAYQYRFMSRPAASSHLRQKGLRITANRRAILKVLLSAEVPLSLKQIQAGAVEHGLDGDPPDFVTVFRMMTLLEDLKLAHKVDLGWASNHYEMTDSRHHRAYLVCTDCGHVTPLELPCPVERLERRISREHGFTQLTHSLEFFGRCGACRDVGTKP